MALEGVVSCKRRIGFWSMAAAPGARAWNWPHAHGGITEGAMDLEGASATTSFGDVGASSAALVPEAGEPAGISAAPPPAQYGGLGGNVAAGAAEFAQEGAAPMSPLLTGRRKRRRARSVKNREEAESQRMTHIAVERSRRKQMNEHLAVLRSVMLPSYVQRGDQASIIGGALNYVKELEQLIQTLQARKHARDNLSLGVDVAAAVPFAGFFTFPQYSMSGTGGSPTATNTVSVNCDSNGNDANGNDTPAAGSRQSSLADIEVTMVESHANLKVLSRRRPRQLLRVVAGLQGHRLTVLHLNVTSAGPMALYSISLKVEDDCRLSSADDIAAAVHRIVEAVEREEGAAGRRRARVVGVTECSSSRMS